MGKDMIIELLKSQLEAANAANITLSEEMRSMRMSFESTISDLRKTIANLEALLKERDENLNKANAQMRGLKATFLPKQSEKQKPASTEEALAKAEAQERAIKARGNNGVEKTRARDPLQRLHLTPRYENALTPLNEIKLTPAEKTLQGIFFIVLDSVLAGGV